jgi:hypothetical protein
MEGYEDTCRFMRVLEIIKNAQRTNHCAFFGVNLIVIYRVEFSVNSIFVLQNRTR